MAPSESRPMARDSLRKRQRKSAGTQNRRGDVCCKMLHGFLGSRKPETC